MRRSKRFLFCLNFLGRRLHFYNSFEKAGILYHIHWQKFQFLYRIRIIDPTDRSNYLIIHCTMEDLSLPLSPHAHTHTRTPPPHTHTHQLCYLRARALFTVNHSTQSLIYLPTCREGDLNHHNRGRQTLLMTYVTDMYGVKPICDSEGSSDIGKGQKALSCCALLVFVIPYFVTLACLYELYTCIIYSQKYFPACTSTA